jgi:hypothetical protein
VFFTLALLLLAVWIIGLAFKVTFWFIHLALVAAVVLFIAGLLRSKTVGRGRPTRTV